MDTALMEKELIAMGEKSLRAARSLALLSAEEKVNVLNSMADAVESATAEVLAANAIDMENAVKNNLSSAMQDRLLRCMLPQISPKGDHGQFSYRLSRNDWLSPWPHNFFLIRASM